MLKKELKIPIKFFNWKYDVSIYPGSKKKSKMTGNCQLFIYKLLRTNGLQIPDFRSSELWEDKEVTKKVKKLRPFDILLFNREEGAAYSSHLGLYLGNNRIIHVSQKVGYPAVWTMDDFLKTKRYKYFIGAKRLKCSSVLFPNNKAVTLL